MTTATPQHEGGVAWELDQAAALILASWSADDRDGVLLGLLRYAEGLRNSSLSVVGQVISPLAEQIAGLRGVVERLERLDIDRWQEFRTHIDSVGEGLGRQIDQVVGSVREVAARQGKTEHQLEALEKELAALALRDTLQYEDGQRDRAAIHAEIEVIKRRLRDLEVRGDG